MGGAFSWAALADMAERLLVIGMYSWLVWRLLPHGDARLAQTNVLLLLSEGVVLVLFVIRRPATAISVRRSDWLLALGGTLLPMLVQPAGPGAGLLPPLVCVFTMICGLVVQIHAKLALGRSIGLVAANRGLKHSGPYNLVRHPMYAGYLLTDIGFWLNSPTLWNAAVYAAALGVQVLRILAEERFLSQSETYRDYIQRVRFRLVPGVF
jgi:protein-S-isoprenylcysteine O-methyltransferase Ste14